jgi:hypothetical protein
MATKEQIKEWNKTYYQKNKDKRRAQYTKYRTELKKWLREYKSTLSCERCGFSHPAALAFHHKDQSTKVKEVSVMVCDGLSRATIEEEISKCEVLCHNCHAIHHDGN